MRGCVGRSDEGAYRYYVSHSLLGKGKTEDTNGDVAGLRIPAQELEGAVRQMLLGYLNDPPRMLADFGHQDAVGYQAMTRQAKRLAQTLEQGTTRDRMGLIDTLIDRVTVSRDQLEVIVKRSALVTESNEDAAVVTIALPVRFRRCGFGIRLIVPTQNSHASIAVDVRLVKLVRRGIGWYRQMVTGRVWPSAIAKVEGVSPSLVQRTIYVAFLAPDIVTAIEAGRQPVTLTPDSLLKALPLPACWNEQRRLLGMETTEK